MYNKYQLRKGRRISNMILASLTLLLVLMYACASCVSVKMRNFEQGAKLYEVEKQHTKIILERLNENIAKLDSTETVKIRSAIERIQNLI